MNKEKIKGKNGLAFEPAVSFIIFATNEKLISVINCIFDGISDLFFVPINKINNIEIALKVMNKDALVKEISTSPNLISGPIL